MGGAFEALDRLDRAVNKAAFVLTAGELLLQEDGGWGDETLSGFGEDATEAVRMLRAAREELAALLKPFAEPRE